MLYVQNLRLYSGEDTLQHKTARSLLDIKTEEARCFQGSTGDKENIFIVMRDTLNPNQDNGAEIVYWVGDRNNPRRSSIFRCSRTGGYQILK